MAGEILSSGNPRRLLEGVRLWYGQAYKEFPKEYEMFMNTIKSDRAYEDIINMAGMGLAVKKPEGAPVVFDDIKQGYATRMIPSVYAKAFMISQEAQEDDLYAPNLVALASKAMARGMVQTKETLCANVLNNAFTAPAVQGVNGGGDNLSLANSAHLLAKSSVTFSNVPSTIVELSEAGLEQAHIDIAAWVDDAGLKINVKPMKLVISTTNEFNAQRILKSEQRVATTDNDINALRSLGKFPGGVAILHYLTAAQPWFILTDQNDDSGLVLVEREGIEMKADTDFDTQSDKFLIKERFVAASGDPRCIYGVNAT